MLQIYDFLFTAGNYLIAVFAGWLLILGTDTWKHPQVPKKVPPPRIRPTKKIYPRVPREIQKNRTCVRGSGIYAISGPTPRE
jgi:hypothetical protein